MFRKSLTLLLIIAIIALMLPTGRVSAHRPDKGNNEGITQIADPQVSFAFYRTFDASDQVHFYQFNGEKGRSFHAGINIPQLARLKDYGVNLAVIGPGLPALTVNEEGLPFGFAQHGSQADHGPNAQFTAPELPAEIDLSRVGGILKANEARGDFFEPFTMTRYWSKQEINLTLPESDIYYLVVWNASGQPGKYVLDTGRLEVFGPADLLNFPVWFIQTHLYFENYALLAGLPLAVLLLLAAWIARRRRFFRATPGID